MVVGHDGAVGVDDEAGAARLDRVPLLLPAVRDHLVERERQLRHLADPGPGFSSCSIAAGVAFTCW